MSSSGEAGGDAGGHCGGGFPFLFRLRHQRPDDSRKKRLRMPSLEQLFVPPVLVSRLECLKTWVNSGSS